MTKIVNFWIRLVMNYLDSNINNWKTSTKVLLICKRNSMRRRLNSRTILKNGLGLKNRSLSLRWLWSRPILKKSQTSRKFSMNFFSLSIVAQMQRFFRKRLIWRLLCISLSLTWTKSLKIRSLKKLRYMLIPPSAHWRSMLGKLSKSSINSKWSLPLVQQYLLLSPQQKWISQCLHLKYQECYLRFHKCQIQEASQLLEQTITLIQAWTKLRESNPLDWNSYRKIRNQ